MLHLLHTVTGMQDTGLQQLYLGGHEHLSEEAHLRPCTMQAHSAS